MRSDDDSDTTNDRKSGGMREQRQQQLRLEISRETARLFWEHGVAATSGEQIANAVGISVRTQGELC
jgi:AcrR family transcriptional regulator